MSTTGVTIESGKFSPAIKKANGTLRIAVETASARRLSDEFLINNQSPIKRDIILSVIKTRWGYYFKWIKQYPSNTFRK